MSGDGDDRLANWLGALASLASSAQRSAMTPATLDSRTAALLGVREFPAITVGELASVLELTHSATVRIVDNLVADGLVKRARGDGDARRVSVTVTRQGRRAADRIQRRRLDALTGLLAPLEPSQRAQFADLLALVLGGEARERATARRICRFCAHRVCRGADCPVGNSVAAPRADHRL